jgi:hypothetical protein
MHKKLPITNCRFIRESKATNFIKNNKQLYSEIKEVLENDANGRVVFGRTVTVGPDTRLVALGEGSLLLRLFLQLSDLLYTYKNEIEMYSIFINVK